MVAGLQDKIASNHAADCHMIVLEGEVVAAIAKRAGSAKPPARHRRHFLLQCSIIAPDRGRALQPSRSSSHFSSHLIE
jgi:hypothetical protein